MAIDSQGRWGPAVAAALQAFQPPQDSFITNAELIQVWKIITGQHQQELNNHQDIDLLASDIKVDPGTFTDSIHGPVTGVGVSEAATLTQRTK